jgi:hypothetical protein
LFVCDIFALFYLVFIGLVSVHGTMTGHNWDIINI